MNKININLIYKNYENKKNQKKWNKVFKFKKVKKKVISNINQKLKKMLIKGPYNNY